MLTITILEIPSIPGMGTFTILLINRKIGDNSAKLRNTFHLDRQRETWLEYLESLEVRKSYNWTLKLRNYG
jgi:hypothetical protein